MEVHHHPQLHHQPKPWKEYLLEGLMIFLAVTLGFFAEQLRERFVEHRKAREYAESLCSDLRIDTFTIQRTLGEKEWILAKYDTALRMLSSAQPTDDAFLYYVADYMVFTDVFTPQDVTYKQLESSGSFSYLRNLELYKSVADYYNLYSRYETLEGGFGWKGDNGLTEVESRLFDTEALNELINKDGSTFYNLVLRPAGEKFSPLAGSQADRDYFYLRVSECRFRTQGSMRFLGWLKDKATTLISELQKEYKIREGS